MNKHIYAVLAICLLPAGIQAQYLYPENDSGNPWQIEDPAARAAAAPAPEMLENYCKGQIPKEQAVPVFQKGDRAVYVQPGSECAVKYMSHWLSNHKDDRAQIEALAQQRQACEAGRANEQSDPNQEVCPVCNQPIVRGCGLSSAQVEGERRHFHQDCLLRSRYEAQEKKVREAVGVTPEMSEAAATRTERLKREQQALMAELRKEHAQYERQTRDNAQATVVNNPVSKETMDKYIRKNQSALKRIAAKRRAGKTLSKKEDFLLRQFDAMRESYSNQTPYQPPKVD